MSPEGARGPLISISIHLALASASQASMTQHLLMGMKWPDGYKELHFVKQGGKTGVEKMKDEVNLIFNISFRIP